MLPKKRRIARKYFSHILATGRRYNSPTILLYIALNNNKSEETKFSFSVSKKVCPKAPDRNKLRRQGYFAVSKTLNAINPGFLCFFSFKKTAKPSYKTLEKEINQLLSSSGVLR